MKKMVLFPFLFEECSVKRQSGAYTGHDACGCVTLSWELRSRTKAGSEYLHSTRPHPSLAFLIFFYIHFFLQIHNIGQVVTPLFCNRLYHVHYCAKSSGIQEAESV